MVGPWMWGESLTHLDVSTVCYWDFIRLGVPNLFATLDCPRIADIAARAEELDAFRKTVPVPLIHVRTSCRKRVHRTGVPAGGQRIATRLCVAWSC